MAVRVWSVVDDRLIEICGEGAAEGAGFDVQGLPAARSRTTRDRVRAALVNSGIVSEAPAVRLRLVPSLTQGGKGELDVALALAALSFAGLLGDGPGWTAPPGVGRRITENHRRS